MKRKILSFLSIMAILIGFIPFNLAVVNAELSFNKLREVDKWSFNEYWYKITKAFFKLDETFKVDFVIDTKIANQLLDYVEKAYKYLPDDLNNESKYNKAKIALKRGIKYPNNDTYFESIRKALEDFIEKPKIQQIKGSILATPNEWNAPLVTTLSAELEDPSGTQISRSSYIWWMNINWKRIVIWTKPTISKTFNEEGTFTVFLDVKSSHKNSFWNRDVLPYSGSVKVKVKQKIASVILRISWKSLDYNNEIKFSPETAGYGLIFDATSSVAAVGTKFLTTTWDFGNWVKKSYSGWPRIERIIYSREWNYDAVLKLKTNRWKIIKKKFKILVHKPIASIKANKTEGFIWDRFNFRAKAYWNTKYLSYFWEIIDTKKDKKIFSKIWNLFTYSFKDKWVYSVVLKIKDAAGNVDVDTKTIYINSRPPIANFRTEIPFPNKPNKVFFDATSSFDPDYSDDGNLKYSWTIDGQKVNLEESNEDWSTGFYTFPTIWDHSVILEVEDLDEMTSTLRSSVKINSILDIDFSIYPRVVQREKTVRFIAESKQAEFFTWNFGDGEIKSTKSSKITHSYSKSGIFPVKVTVRWKNRTKNTYIKNVYVWDSKNPVSVIDISKQWGFDFRKEKNACSWKTAYIVTRKDNLTFSWRDSIDTNGLNNGLSYSWLVWQWEYKSGQSINERFDELGCYRVKLTVKSEKDKTTDSSEIWVKVENMKPILSGLKISPIDLKTDPVIVNVSALGAKDPDWVIQSYLWYYTTDIDNEAQDFRITQTPKTTFVIPKIQGTYYFGVMMKDNNGAKVSSEDLINKIWNNFIELQWDNTNTPLIDFSVSDSSVTIGQEVSFRAVATNIRWDSIEKTAEFSWDFDWDWFYDKKTKTWNVTYKYKKSGTFYPKVKVRNKGFSNTRTLTVNVSNKLVSDFKYISIWNKYVFVDTSKWTIEKNIWDLWDGTKEEDKEKFIHNYKDKKSVHSVELTVAEWSKVKKTTKEVEKDFKNLIKSRRKGLHVFTFPALSKDWTITLDEEESVYIYLWESKWDFKYYWIDYDIDKDSDVNGWDDDDIDNKNKSSYKTGNPDEIPLNDNREQTIRVFLLDKNEKIIDSKDIKIVKNYIEEKQNLKIGEFKWVTEAEKAKIEKLKIAVSKLPQQNRIQAMQYIQKMQENWWDETEKVRTIIAFEQFLDTTWYKNVDNIIDLLESLISENNSDEKSVAFEALKALIPNDIECSVASWTCKEDLIKKLEKIKNSNNIEENRAIWKEILGPIGKDKKMTKKQKNDFKGILRILVYSWVNNIPKNELDEQRNDDTKTPWTVWTGSTNQTTDDWEWLWSFLKNVGWWIAGAVWIIIFLLFIFWIIDFLKNRKSWESFEDFVENKSSENTDVLWGFEDPLEENKEKEEKIEEKPSAVFTPEVKLEDSKIEEEPNKEENKSEEVKIENTSEEIPDWLSWTLEEESKEDDTKIEEPKKEEIKSEEDELWFSLDIPEEEKTMEEEFNKVEEKKDKKEEKNETKSEDDELDFDIEKETSLDDIEEDNTPDWLKDSLTEKLPEKEEVEEPEDFNLEEENIEEKKEEVEPVVIEDKKEEELKLDSEEDIPDWLKWSLDESKKEQDKKEEDKKEDKENKKEDKKEKTQMWDKVKLDEEDIPDWLKDSLVEEKTEEKEDKKEKKTDNKTNNKKEEKTEKPKRKRRTKKVEKTKTKEEEKKQEEKKSDKKDDELWDDWMTVPDWLKSE